VETTLLRKVGLFDEFFQDEGLEDLELGFRLYKAGFTFSTHPYIRGLVLANNQNYIHKIRSTDRAWFSRKHSSIPVELCCLPTQHYVISIYKHFLKGIQDIQLDYEDLEGLIPEVTFGRRLIVGCTSKKLANRLIGSDIYGLDPDVLQLSSQHNVFERIGFFSTSGTLNMIL
jgi:hypothetical protein